MINPRPGFPAQQIRRNEPANTKLIYKPVEYQLEGSRTNTRENKNPLHTKALAPNKLAKTQGKFKYKTNQPITSLLTNLGEIESAKIDYSKFKLQNSSLGKYEGKILLPPKEEEAEKGQYCFHGYHTSTLNTKKSQEKLAKKSLAHSAKHKKTVYANREQADSSQDIIDNQGKFNSTGNVINSQLFKQKLAK